MFKVAPTIAVLACLLAGCAQPSIQPPDVVAVPTVEPETAAASEPTVLERLQETSRQLDAEKRRADALAGQLAEQKAARDKAEAEVDRLRQQVVNLERLAKQLDEMRAKFDAAQKSSLELENVTRDLRRELLEERLAGAKREQTILALKIERAMDRRRQTPDPIAKDTSMEKRDDIAKP